MTAHASLASGLTAEKGDIEVTCNTLAFTRPDQRENAKQRETQDCSPKFINPGYATTLTVMACS